MAKFLNTKGLNKWIPRLVNRTKRELVLVVPYIKTPERLFEELYNANERGVETTIVYREDKLNDKEKNRLLSLNNLNLMHHPNIHAKCYYNEGHLIISSMNMYEFSSRNNREMGILLRKPVVGVDYEEDEEDESNDNTNSFGYSPYDQRTIFEDAVLEIRDILNGATMERPSRETVEEGFEMDIIKTPIEKAQEQCDLINKIFIHKKFQPIGEKRDFVPVCQNYFDHLDLAFTHRAELQFTYDLVRINEIYNREEKENDEFLFKGFKYYWSHPKGTITLYADRGHKIWQECDDNKWYSQMKDGVDAVIVHLRKFI